MGMTESENESRKIRLSASWVMGDLAGDWAAVTSENGSAIVRIRFLMARDRILVVGSLEECRAFFSRDRAFHAALRGANYTPTY